MEKSGKDLRSSRNVILVLQYRPLKKSLKNKEN